MKGRGREERDRRRKENEFKTSSFQQINGEKLKKMSKKQLKKYCQDIHGKEWTGVGFCLQEIRRAVELMACIQLCSGIRIVS